MSRELVIPPLQPLLFQNVCLLLLVSGLLASLFLPGGLLAAGLILLADSRLHPRILGRELRGRQLRQPEQPLQSEQLRQPEPSWQSVQLENAGQFRQYRRFGPLAVGVLAFLGGLWWGSLHAVPEQPQAPGWIPKVVVGKPEPVLLRGQVLSCRGLPDRRLRIELADVRPCNVSEGVPLPGTLSWVWTDPLFRPLPGQSIQVSLPLRPVQGFENRDTFNLATRLRSQDIFFQSYSRGKAGEPVVSGTPERLAALREMLRRDLVQALAAFDLSSGSGKAQGAVSGEELLPEGKGLEENGLMPKLSPGTALIPALVFGDRFDVSSESLRLVNHAGLAHSLALSGQHLAVVGLLALFVSAFWTRMFPGILLHVPARLLTGAGALPLAALYLWLGDAPPSLIRAALMLFFWYALRVVGCLSARSLGGSLLRQRLIGRLAGMVQVAFPDILVLVLAIMAVADPLCLLDLGVQLSFACVAAISLGMPLLLRLWRGGVLADSTPQRDRVPFWKKGGRLFVRGAWLTLGTSCVAQLATLPFTLRAFGMTTLWFPLNVLWLPVLGFWVLPCAFLGLLGLALPEGLILFGLPVESMLPGVASVPCAWLLEGLGWLETHAGMDALYTLIPHWTAIPGLAALSAGLALHQNRKMLPVAGRRLCLAGVVLLLITPGMYFKEQFSPRIGLRLLDVGQGQAALLEWPGGRGLVDGGGLSSFRFDIGQQVLSPALARQAPLSLSFVALSHPDRDHMQGLHFITRYYAIGAAYSSRLPGLEDGYSAPIRLPEAAVLSGTGPLPSIPGIPEDMIRSALWRDMLLTAGIPRHTLCAGMEIPLEGPGRIPGLRLEVLGPPAGVSTHGNNGLVLRLVLHDRGLVLLPGDATASYLLGLHLAGKDLSADVLVLGHHGAASSLSETLLPYIRPRLALASAGQGNPYGHPSPSVVELLARYGIPLLNTADTGEIRLGWPLGAEDLPAGVWGTLARWLGQTLPQSLWIETARHPERVLFENAGRTSGSKKNF